jgi:PII-like signaling protein
MLSVVDTEERLRTILPMLDGTVQRGLVVFSDLDVIKYTRDFQEVERRKEARK